MITFKKFHKISLPGIGGKKWEHAMNEVKISKLSPQRLNKKIRSPRDGAHKNLSVRQHFYEVNRMIPVFPDCLGEKFCGIFNIK